MKALNPYFYALDPDILAYENAWVNYTKNRERNSTVINDDVWESWIRSTQYEIDPLSDEKIAMINESDLLNKIGHRRQLISIITPFLDTIYNVVKGPGFMITFADKDGVILLSNCDDELMDKQRQIGLVPGADLSESKVGTNSVDLSIKLKKAISVTGAEHYGEIFHSLVSVSAPIINYTGELVGIISVWGRHEHTSAHLLGMIISTAKAIENELKIQKINEQLIENNNQLKAILESVSDGVVYLNDNRITQVNNEMLVLIDSGVNEVVNRDIDQVIISNPEITKVMDKLKKSDSTQVTLYGRTKSFKCLVSKKVVYGSNKNELGKVLIFKRLDGIKRLAKSINMHSAKYHFDDIIGTSKVLVDEINTAKKTAEHDSRIVIEGESGTGKEMFAQAIHNGSARSNEPFVALDCGAIPIDLFESTLFGYEKGSFTGAKESGNTGAFEQANKGTLFLDEIGNMPSEVQIKLLRVLQENAVTKVGSSIPIPIDVRIIVATNETLQQLVDSGKFREDLYYRLNIVKLSTPSLRERKEDIPLLVQNYLKKNRVADKVKTIDYQTLEILKRYDWPGNIRQLFNAIERAGIMATDNMIKVEDLPLEIIHKTNPDLILETEGKEFSYESDDVLTLKQLNKKYIQFLLSKNNHNIKKTADMLGITRATVYKVIKDE